MFKKTVATATLALTLLTAVPAPQAQAGIICLPAGFGVAFLVLGIIYDNVLLIVLDGSGSVDQGQLEQAIAKNFPAIEDRDVVRALAAAVRNQAESAPADAEGRKVVRLDREQVLEILAPTGLADLDPAAAEKIVSALN